MKMVFKETTDLQKQQVHQNNTKYENSIPVSQETHSIPITKTNTLMFFIEITAVYSENHMNCFLLVLKQVVLCFTGFILDVRLKYVTVKPNHIHMNTKP
jgi:hypothetical protein